MKNLKEKYIELIRERSYLMQTSYLYNKHYEQIHKLDKEIENIKNEMKNK